MIAYENQDIVAVGQSGAVGILRRQPCQAGGLGVRRAHIFIRRHGAGGILKPPTARRELRTCAFIMGLFALPESVLVPNRLIGLETYGLIGNAMEGTERLGPHGRD